MKTPIELSDMPPLPPSVHETEIVQGECSGVQEWDSEWPEMYGSTKDYKGEQGGLKTCEDHVCTPEYLRSVIEGVPDDPKKGDTQPKTGFKTSTLVTLLHHLDNGSLGYRDAVYLCRVLRELLVEKEK